MLLNKATRTH